MARFEPPPGDPGPHGPEAAATPTPGVRAVLVALDALIDDRVWPELGPITVGHGGGSALVRLPHRLEPDLDLEVEIGDRRIRVRYPPEEISFTNPDEAVRFVAMLGDGRVELEIRRSAWATMSSFRDGLPVPFRRSRMPWPTLRPRIERRRFGFG
ncbi:MAG: hypothetical protein ACKOBG_06285 [Actinomycetota bacterium]